MVAGVVRLRHHRANQRTVRSEHLSPSQVTVSGGALHLTAVAEQNTDAKGTYSYTSGVVTTMAPTYPWTVPALFSFTYGYMEARIWMPGTSGVADWPAFWAHGFSPDATNGEINVAEGLGGSVGATFHNLAGAQGTTFATGPFTGGWHTFGANKNQDRSRTTTMASRLPSTHQGLPHRPCI